MWQRISENAPVFHCSRTIQEQTKERSRFHVGRLMTPPNLNQTDSVTSVQNRDHMQRLGFMFLLSPVSFYLTTFSPQRAKTWQWWRSYCLHLDQRLKRKEVTRSQWTAPCRRTDHTKWRGCSTGKKWTVTTIWGCRSLSASPLWTHAPLMAFTCQSSLFELRAAAVHLQSSAFEWERERVQMFKVK